MAKKKSQKKSDLRQYAPIGLWISGAALLALVILLVIKLLAFLGIYTPTSEKQINLPLWISLGLVIIGPALYALFNPKRVREFITGRQARYGSNALIMLIAFVGILVIINIITYNNPKQWDVTEGKQHTLAPETLDTLHALPSPVRAYAFYSQSYYSSDTDKQLLADIKTSSDGKFDYEIIDPDLDPVKAQQFKVTQDGTVVLTLGSQQEMITYTSEEDITNALVRLMNPGKRSIYFLVGHGEHDIKGSDNSAYTQLRTVLEAKNYTVSALNLNAQNQIPQDALVIIVAGPLQPVSSTEVDLLKGYMNRGGSLIVMEEPLAVTSFNGEQDPLADFLATDWGITLNNDLIVDPNSSQPLIPVANSYGDHPITQKLRNIVSFYPTARSLTVTTTNQNISPVILVTTIERAWGETNMAELDAGQPTFDSADNAGPLNLAAAAENSTTKGRVVVFGDSDFASDSIFKQYANGDMLVNSIDWAAQQENMISLTAKTSIERTLILPSNITQLLIGVSFLCIIPGLIVAGGVVSWLLRRTRG